MLDAYARRARLAPAALAAAPPLVLAGGALTAIEDQGSAIAFVLAALAVVLCGLVRGLGRRLEPALWESWGGAPTTQLLRWRGPSDRTTLTRRHALLAELIGEPLPTAEEERGDPDGADERYVMATTALRERTRSPEKFPLVATENAEYGFRRNCLGLRPFSIGTAIFTFLISTTLIFAVSASGRFIVPAVVSCVALLGLLTIVRPPWVRSAADLYAARLMEALESLTACPAGSSV